MWIESSHAQLPLFIQYSDVRFSLMKTQSTRKSNHVITHLSWRYRLYSVCRVYTASHYSIHHLLGATVLCSFSRHQRMIYRDTQPTTKGPNRLYPYSLHTFGNDMISPCRKHYHCSPITFDILPKQHAYRHCLCYCLSRAEMSNRSMALICRSIQTIFASTISNNQRRPAPRGIGTSPMVCKNYYST